MPVPFDELLKEYQHAVIGPFVLQTAFEVPPNQRPYAWEIEHWTDLWEDLIDTVKENADRTSDPFYAYHFFGPMFFAKKADSMGLRILDGQQRLATIIIGLAAIRDILRYLQFSGRMLTVGFDLPGKISLFVEESLTGIPRQRVILGKENRTFFEKVINPVQHGKERASLSSKSKS